MLKSLHLTRSLHARMALVLLALLLVVGVANFLWTLLTQRLYQQEVSQSMNLELAAHIAGAKHKTLLTPAGRIRGEGLQELFHWLMVVNPGVEFYLLGVEGEILAYDDTPGLAVLDRVDMEPVWSFLDRSEPLPILGDDPRRPDRRRIFTVAPLPPEGAPRGYLYIVLASERLDLAVASLRQSYMLRLGAWMVLGCVAIAAFVGLLAFRRLTRPLRELTRRIHSFQRRIEGEPEKDLSEKPLVLPSSASRESAGGLAGGAGEEQEGDEVAILHRSFDRMATRIRDQLEEIQGMEDQRRELITSVSHDLRTPIASLQGYLETLVLKKETLTEADRQQYLSTALRQSQRLGRLVAELFELTKLGRQDVTVAPEAFSLSELAQDNVQRYRLPAQERGVRLEAKLDPALPFVEADLGLVDRVLDNLIGNALRFTPAGGSVKVSLEEEAEGIRVKVVDTGCGIPEEELPLIFDRYFRGYRDGRQTASGIGLGLAICRRIVELHGSDLTVLSKVGVGTTFSFLLPKA